MLSILQNTYINHVRENHRKRTCTTEPNTTSALLIKYTLAMWSFGTLDHNMILSHGQANKTKAYPNLKSRPRRLRIERPERRERRRETPAADMY